MYGRIGDKAPTIGERAFGNTKLKHCELMTRSGSVAKLEVKGSVPKRRRAFYDPQ
jgi:hypothetical protein